jgi:hypothetical protein
MKQYLVILVLCLASVAARAQSTQKDVVTTSPLHQESVRELEKNADFTNALSIIKEQLERPEFEKATITTHTANPNDFSVRIPIGGLGQADPRYFQLVYQEFGGKTLVYFAQPNPTWSAAAPGGPPLPYLPPPCVVRPTCGAWVQVAMTGCVPIMQDLCHTDALPPWSNVHMAILQRTCTCDIRPPFTFVQTMMVVADCDCWQPL